jgi:ribosomal protein S20
LKTIWPEVGVKTVARSRLAPNLHADYETAQKALRELKSKISSQSKKNFVLEKDVRYLDSRIALLIQNRMALEEVC